MKKTILLFLPAICLTIAAFPQDYTTILTGEIHLFEPEETLTIRDLPPERYVRGVKTDSILVEGGDTLIFFQKETVCGDNLNPYNTECMIGPSWLGKGVLPSQTITMIPITILVWEKQPL